MNPLSLTSQDRSKIGPSDSQTDTDRDKIISRHLSSENEEKETTIFAVAVIKEAKRKEARARQASNQNCRVSQGHKRQSGNQMFGHPKCEEAANYQRGKFANCMQI